MKKADNKSIKANAKAPDTETTDVSRQLTASHWGTAVVEVAGDRLLSVTGHQDDPDPSAINRNYIAAVDGPARVRQPSVRASYLDGNRNSKHLRGQEQFIEVSWETAENLVVDALKETIEKHGNQSIFGGSYGWASAGRFHHAQSQLKRFLNCAGGFVRSEGNYSYNAALVLMPHIVGNYRLHIKQATRWATVKDHTQLVVMFGGLPLRSAQVGGGGMAKHRLKHELIACRKAGVEFINISPLRTDAIDELDASWIPVIPGSDTAVMMALAHTIITENLHNTEFLQRYTTGFDKVADYISGRSDGLPKDATWASKLSGIEADTLRTLARRMASSNTLICTTAGVQRAESGEQPLWMTVTLASILGQIGLPGCGYGIGYAADASIGTTDRPLRWPSLPQGTNPVEDYIPVAAITDMLMKPSQPYQYNGEDRIYPDIKLMWWAGGNPFHHHQNLNQLTKAFQQPDTVIVGEINWTGTARHADIVLPSTSTLERNDFGAGTQDTALIPMPRAIQPIAGARDEYDTYAALALKMGFESEFTEGRTSQQWLEEMWETMQSTAATIDRQLPDFATFLQGDIIEFDNPDPKHTFLAEFRADPVKNPLPTPDGRIALFSSVINSFNYADCPGHASWLPPTEWLGSPLADSFPLHMISGQPQTRLHSQWDDGEYSRSKKIKGREPVLIHPVNAKDRGINDGDIVRVFNDRGACLAGAVITNDVRPNVIFLWTGAWFDPQLSSEQPLDKHGNPNVLTHDRRASRLSQGPAAHSTLVDLEKWEKPLPEVTAFIPPIRNH